MIDLDKTEASVNQLMRMYPKCTRATQTIGDVHELIALLRQAEKDAARYRWLRDEAIEHQDFGPLITFSDFNGEPCSFGDSGSILSHDDADKAIDEAMQCK